MTCPNCHSETAPGARFCVECGASLAQACPACGAEYRPGQKFCGECGTALAATPATREIAPELRVVSVLFVDLVGYTSLSESRDAEDVRELLGRYFDTARTIVGRYGGTVEKFIGDAVMAVWGTPVAREDDAERAVRAGLELVDAVAAFGEDVGAPQLRARAGVVTGQVAAMASPGEGLVVGDRVNTASRVQSVAEPGTVFVDDVTRHATSEAITYADAGEHTVKGKSEPLRLWRAERVVGRRAGAGRRGGLEAPFVGRDSELRLVKELYHAGIERGTARLVAVSGTAGVGKSRLLWEFEKYVDGVSTGALWHLGRCLSYGDGVAYWALAEMVRQRLGIAEDEPAAAAAQKLADGLERWVPDPGDREYVGPRLGALLGVVDPGLGREELFAGWRLFFERLAALDPLVLAFEDLQWADPGLLDFIEHLLEWSAQHPIFVLTFARPELADRRPGWAAGRRWAIPVYLEPLGHDAMGELLDGLVTDLPPETHERIVQQAEGIPLYALETVRALADRGVLVSVDGRLTPAGDVGELAVPSTLSSLLAARLDALDPAERELVKAMSVFGGSFPRAAAAALCAVPAERLDDVLASLVRKDILTVRADRRSPDRGQYAFGQGLLRTVAYEMLPRRERKPRHLAAATHLRATFADDGEEVSEVVATHYLAAVEAAPDDPDTPDLRAEALRALSRAAQRAAVIGAPESAERAYRAAVELVDDDAERAELTQAAGEMALLAGRFEAAIALFEDAASLHLANGRDRAAARLSGRIGEALWNIGRLEAGIERMREALAVLDTGALDADVAALSVELGRSLNLTGHVDEGEPHVDRALAVGQALELPSVVCQALIAKGVALTYQSRYEESRALLEAAVGLADRSGLDSERHRAETNLADLQLRRDLPGVIESCSRALAVARRIGHKSGECLAAGNLMLALTFAGQWDEVDQLGGELLAPDRPEPPGAEFVHERLVALSALRGDLPMAELHLDGLAAWAGHDDLELRLSHATAVGAVAIARGETRAGFERLRDVAEAALELRLAEALRMVWPEAVEAAIELDRLDDAARLVGALREQPPGEVPPYLRAQLRRLDAILAAAQGDHDGVDGAFAAAAEAFAALDYPFWLARTRVDHAASLIERRRAPEAALLLDQAIETLTRLGAGPALEHAQEMRSSARVAAVA